MNLSTQSLSTRSTQSKIRKALAVVALVALPTMLGLVACEDAAGTRPDVVMVSDGTMTTDTKPVDQTPSACEEPNPAGCSVTGCDVGEICDMSLGCAPSNCSCDEATGTWGCTNDCGGGTCVEDNTVGCSGPNPAGCASRGCTDGNVCVPSGQCVPSSCSCDDDTHTWICTEDCNGGQCLPEETFCDTPNPEGCAQNGCPDGEECVVGEECVSSGCTCDPESRQWNCDADCGGGICVGMDMVVCEDPNPQGCVETGCPDGQICDTDAEVCAPSTCVCDEDSEQWLCSTDCNGGVCVDEPSVCMGANPQGCAETGCEGGFVCDTTVGDHPTRCTCDEELEDWVCSRDTAGGECVPPMCTTANPAACTSDSDCRQGSVCDRDDSSEGCKPSECTCQDGEWVCSKDCVMGGVCKPSSKACKEDNQCSSGNEWCTGTGCVACDNSGFACDLACPEGQMIESRNGCSPCRCVPENECTTDAECQMGFPFGALCRPGPQCHSGCTSATDPECCYGNTCSNSP